MHTVSHKELVEHTRKELSQFPDLARKYYISLLLSLLELRKLPSYFIESCKLLGKFKNAPFFKEAALSENMDKSVFSSLLLSIGNTLMFAKEFTDEEAEEFRVMLVELNPHSLRNHFVSKGVIFCETFSYLNNIERNIWKVMNQRIDVGSRTVELFCVKTDKFREIIDEFVSKKVKQEEDLAFHDFLPQGTMSTITPKGRLWRYSIFANTISGQSDIYLISVAEQY